MRKATAISIESPLSGPSAAERAIARSRRGVSQSVLREILGLASRPGVLSFAVGFPAPELFPAAELAAAAERLLADDRKSLQYAIPYPPLKARVVEMMALRGVSCRAEQVFLTSGAQQGMDLAAHLLIAPGDRVLVERTVYDGMRMAIKKLAPEVLTVPTDVATGIDVDAVEEVLAAGPAPSFLYVITDGHNPLGVSVSPDKRDRLVELARRHRMPILEDDAYGFLYYEESPAPPLRAREADWVFYLGSFSKILAPALRAGWMVVPEPLVPTLAALKHGADLDTPSFSQRMIADYLATGSLPGHLARVRAEYRRRRDAMLSALDRHLAGVATWNRPASGMFVWLELPAGMDAMALARSAIAREGVAVSPGIAFAEDGARHARHCLRLAFANNPPDAIAEGIERLALAIRREARP